MKKKWISSKDKGWSVAGKVTQDNPNAGQTKGLTTSKGKVQPLLLPQLIFYLEQMECPCSCIDFSRSKELQGLDTVCWSQDFSEAQVTMWAINYCHYQYHWFERLNWLRLYQSAAHSQVIEDATRLQFEMGRWRASWRLLLASCRCKPYLKARNNSTHVFIFGSRCLMCICSRAFWINDLVLQFLCCLEVQARLEWQRKWQFA